METGYRRCCGIDVHKKSVTVHVLPASGETGTRVPLEKEYRTFSRDLRRMRGWLKNCRVTEVVMEATGQYWRAVWNVLEDEVPHLLLVNPLHVKALAGRKTDRIDSRRLARYLERGELQGSFIPPRPIRELRDLTRGRIHLLEEVNRVKNRVGQMCEAGNIKVSSVASDLFGASGRRMLQGLVEGNRDPGWMADWARGRLREKRKQLQWALEGSFSEHQRWMLREELGHLQSLEGQIGRTEAQIAERMQPYAEQIRRLATIPGVDRITAWTILSELGPDMSVFPTAAQAASWAGLCPGNDESGGRQRSGRTRKANAYLRRNLCQAPWAASHTKNTYLAALYRRLRARRGHNKAVVAVAHQILVIAYHILRDGVDYQEKGGDYFDRQNRPKVARRLVERLTRLGYYVSLQEAAEVPLGSDGRVNGESGPAGAARAPSEARGGALTESVTAATSRRRPRGRPCQCAARGLSCNHKTRGFSELRDAQPPDASTDSGAYFS